MYKKIPTAHRTPSGCALLIAFFLVCLLLSLAGCSRRDTIAAPAESCTSQPTGHTRQWQTMVCYAFDAKTGACTIWMPQYYEDKEYTTSCVFREWK